MNVRSSKLIIMWNIALTILFIASLAMNAAWAQAASDPPVRVYSAEASDARAGGSSTTTVHDITSSSAIALTSISTTNLSSKHKHTCLVMGSASAAAVTNNGVSKGGSMILGLNMDDSTSTIPATNRYVDFVSGTAVVPEAEAGTVYAFTNVSGPHTFYFSARKRRPLVAATYVNAASMTVVCIKKAL